MQKVAQFYSRPGLLSQSRRRLQADPQDRAAARRREPASWPSSTSSSACLSDAMQQYEAVAAFYHREGKTREALAALKQIVELDPGDRGQPHQAGRAVLEGADGARGHRRVLQGGRAAAAGGAHRRLHEGRRAAAVPLAGQSAGDEGAGRAVHREGRSAARAAEAAGLLQGRSARHRGAVAAGQGVRGARSALEVGVACSRSWRASSARTATRAGATRTWRKILQLAPGDPDAEAALSNPGRARPPSQPSIDEALNSPPPCARRGRASRKPDNSTGGRPVAMSASGRMRTVDDVDGGRDWQKPAAPMASRRRRARRSRIRRRAGSTRPTRTTRRRRARPVAPVPRRRSPRSSTRPTSTSNTTCTPRRSSTCSAPSSATRGTSVRARSSRRSTSSSARRTRRCSSCGRSSRTPSRGASGATCARSSRSIRATRARPASWASAWRRRRTRRRRGSTSYDVGAARDCADPEGTGSEMLDVDDLEELSDDEFDVAEPSNILDSGLLRVDARSAPVAAGAVAGRRTTS